LTPTTTAEYVQLLLLLVLLLRRFNVRHLTSVHSIIVTPTPLTSAQHQVQHGSIFCAAKKRKEASQLRRHTVKMYASAAK